MSNPDRFLMAGVMGSPVMHSRSPRIHNYWFAKSASPGPMCRSRSAPRPPRGAARLTRWALPDATHHPAQGSRVRHRRRIDLPARRIGAVNCVLVAPDGTLDGSNNDGVGYIESILEREPGWRADAGPIVVVGAGGAARPFWFQPRRSGARKSAGQSRRRTRHGAGRDSEAPSGAGMGQPPAALEGAPCSSHHEQGWPTGRARHRARQAAAGALVSDIIYIPRETPLLTAARRRGNPTVDGLACCSIRRERRFMPGSA